MMTKFGTLLLRISPQRIGFIKFILEGYDGMALVSTLDPKSGSIIVRYPLSFHEELSAIIVDLSPLLLEESPKTPKPLLRNGHGQEGQGFIYTKLQH